MNAVISMRATRNAFALTFAIALCAIAALPGVANAAFGISNVALTPSSTQAAGHPDVTIGFNRTGTEAEDLRDMKVTLPQGLLANPEAANPKCTEAQFSVDGCPASSQVGSLSYKYRVRSSFDVTVPGAIYILTPGATDTATVGFVLRPKQYCVWLICAIPDKIYQKTSFKLQRLDNGDPESGGVTISNTGTQNVVNTSIPLLFTSVNLVSDVTVKSVSIKLHKRAGVPGNTTGKFFPVNTSSCAPATTKVAITSYQNVEATGSSTFTPTGCDVVPFDPSIEFAPQDTSAGKESVTVFTLNVPGADAPIQNSSPKGMEITFPPGAGINAAVLGQMITAGSTSPCTDELLIANTCPAASAVGLSAAYSDFLPPNLGGGVYVTGPFTTSIPVAARLTGPRGAVVIVRLRLGIGANGLYAKFDTGPQLPYNKFVFALIPLYVNPELCGSKTSTAAITSWSGHSITRQSSYPLTNCKPPETTITSGPSGPIATNSASFEFNGSPTGVTFKCSLDGSTPTDCTSPYNATGLSVGPHTFSVYGVNGTVPDATPATRTFSYTPPAGAITATMNLTTLQAAAHPGLTSIVNISSGQMRNVSVTFPRGFQASENAVPKCALTAANAGTCPAASKIGTAQVTAQTAGGAVSGVGDVFLSEAPTAADVAGIATKVTLPSGNLITVAGQSTTQNTNTQVLNFRDLPTTVGGTGIDLRQVQMNLPGANRLFTNASSCVTPSSFVVAGTAWNGSIAAPASVPYQATGCASVPFSPTSHHSFPVPPAASTESGVVVDVDIPLDHSSLKRLRTWESLSFGANSNSWGAANDRCPGSSIPDANAEFNEALCPVQARIGTMTINSPLLAVPLVGAVYYVNKTPLPWFGVKFDLPGVKLRLTGVTSTPPADETDPDCDNDPGTVGDTFCQKQILVDFNNLPDTPMTHTRFDLTSGPRARPNGTLIPGEPLVAADSGSSDCISGSNARWEAVSHSGVTVSGVQAIPIIGC